MLSVIVPVYNEEKTIARVLERLLSALQEIEKEIIVVNDGSTDGTEKALAPMRAHIRYIAHDRNRGKGAALRTGFAAAKGELVTVQDGDLEYSPEEFPKLLSALKAHSEWSAIYGSRNLEPTGRGYSHYVLGVWVLTACVNLLFRTRLTDSYTCYKLIRADALRSLGLATNGFEIEMEITAKLLRLGLAIGEVPIGYAPRSFKEGKKIRAKDGIKGLAVLARIFFSGVKALSPQKSAV